MIQVTATNSTKTAAGTAKGTDDAGGLINVLLDYESKRQAKRRDSHRSSRPINRTKPLAGFLNICADTDLQHSERAISDFCKRALKAEHPAHELIGTSLAALEISPKNARRIGTTLMAVLRACVIKLADTEPQTRI